jgi:hypothetical protein
MAVHAAWVKVYSRMLTTIVPIAISMELRGGKSKAHQERISTNHASFMFSQGATSQHNSETASENGDEVEEETRGAMSTKH